MSMFLDVCMCVCERECVCADWATSLDIIGLGSSEALSNVNRCVRCWHFAFPFFSSPLPPIARRGSDGQKNQHRFTRHLFSPLAFCCTKSQDRTFLCIKDVGGGSGEQKMLTGVFLTVFFWNSATLKSSLESQSVTDQHKIFSDENPSIHQFS